MYKFVSKNKFYFIEVLRKQDKARSVRKTSNKAAIEPFLPPRLMLTKVMDDQINKSADKSTEESQPISFSSKNYLAIKGQLQNELRKVDKFCDFTLKTEDGKEINVHKIILISSSPFFADNFDDGDMLKSNPSSMTLKEISAKCLENLVTYMYTGNITIEIANFMDVAAYARYFRLKELDVFCQETLSQMITNSNCIKLWRFAEDRLLGLLRDKCIAHILHNAALLFNDPKCVKLEKHEIKMLLESEKLNCSEEKVYDFILKWTKANAKTMPEIEAAFIEFANLIRFPIMSENYIASIISSNELFENNINFWKKIGKYITHKWLIEDNSTLKISKDVTPRIGSREKNLVCIYDNSIMNISNNLSFSSIKLGKSKKGSSYTMFGTNFLLISGGESNNTCEYYSPIAEKLYTFPSLRKARWGHSSIDVENKIYICGGYEDTLKTSESVEIIDLCMGQWVVGPNLTRRHANFGLTTLDGCLYAFGGGTNCVERLDPRTCSWEVICDTFPFTNDVKSVTVDKIIQCFSKTKRCMFEPRTNKFGDLIDSPVQYAGTFDVCNLHNKIYALGCTSKSAIKCHHINFESNSWTCIWEKNITLPEDSTNAVKSGTSSLGASFTSSTNAFTGFGSTAPSVFRSTANSSYSIPSQTVTAPVKTEENVNLNIDLALISMYLK